MASRSRSGTRGGWRWLPFERPSRRLSAWSLNGRGTEIRHVTSTLHGCASRRTGDEWRKRRRSFTERSLRVCPSSGLSPRQGPTRGSVQRFKGCCPRRSRLCAFGPSRTSWMTGIRYHQWGLRISSPRQRRSYPKGNAEHWPRPRKRLSTIRRRLVTGSLVPPPPQRLRQGPHRFRFPTHSSWCRSKS